MKIDYVAAAGPGVQPVDILRDQDLHEPEFLEPRERVERAFEGVTKADALLVVGSSLMVYSGFRFAEAAAAARKPIAAINLGRTRADHLLALKISAPCDEVLSEVSARLPAATS